MRSKLNLSHALLLASLCASGCARAGSPTPSGNQTTEATKEAAVPEFVGKWTYAEDPKGEAKLDPLYEGSVITLGADHSYNFLMRGTTFALEGTWEVRSSSESEIVLDLDFGQGKSVYYLNPRHEGGELQGMLLYEGEGKQVPPQWLVPAP